MKPWEHRSFNVVAGLVTLTGLAYLVMKVFMESDDPFALVNHPWQPTMLSLHVVAAPILVLFFGMIFRSHTLKKLQSHLASNRRTGWTTLTSFGSMALSGYLLQVVTVPAWLDAHVGNARRLSVAVAPSRADADAVRACQIWSAAVCHLPPRGDANCPSSYPVR